MKSTRSAFIAGAAGAAAAAAAPKAVAAANAARAAAATRLTEPARVRFSARLFELQQHIEAAAAAAEQPPLPNPDVTGVLLSAELAWLHSIAAYVGVKWKIAPSSALTPALFAHYAALKTRQRPSYLTLYRIAIALFKTLSTELGSPVKALEYLYTPNDGGVPPQFPVVRKWAIQEFCNLYVTIGAFRAYGWINYPGWVGGPYNDPAHLPYRRSRVTGLRQHAH